MEILGNLKTIVKSKTPRELAFVLGVWAHVISHEKTRCLFSTLCIPVKTVDS